MQILWKEVFGRDRPLTVDKFLYCYKPLEINQSLGFHQFTARGNDCRLIRTLVCLTETGRRNLSLSPVSGLDTLWTSAGTLLPLILGT